MVPCTILKGHTFPEAQGLCVVIDVLRAFTTAAFAFAAGAKEIVLVASAEEAFRKHQKDPSLVLMGESEGKAIEGFHYENSPYEIQNAPLKDKRIVMRTSSGTQGVVGCSHAPHMLISSFVVAESTIRRILAINPSHVSLIATGRTYGDEDVALAEYLQGKLQQVPTDDEHLLNRVRYSYAAKRMIEGQISYANAVHDIGLAVQVNRFPFAMEVFKEGQELIARPIMMSSVTYP